MQSKFADLARPSSQANFCSVPNYRRNNIIICCNNTNSSSQGHKLRFNFVGDRKWKFRDIDASTVQESVNQWLSKTQNFLNEVTSPLVKTVNDKRTSSRDDTQDTEDMFMAEQTVESRTPNGDLSIAAILSIEQFSRMNGLTGQKMQKIFKALFPESGHSDARSLVEYCCFRFLSKDTSDFHPCLKEPAFQRLIFVTMLAWEQPYRSRGESKAVSKKHTLQLKRRVVGEEAFVRIAPAVSGISDWVTAHNLFKALAGNDQGISFTAWSAYIAELLKVHDGRKSYQFQDFSELQNERILCLASGGKHPVLRWEGNMAWPGKLILTDRALYFEAVGLMGKRNISRLDLTLEGSIARRTRVGPMGFDLLDSAVSITAGPQLDTWVLEFVDFGGEMRRDVWCACISEVIALYKFIREFGPEEGDQSIYNVYGAKKGKERAISYATNAISRLQALQYTRKLLEEPTKLVPFSYSQKAPYGEIVLQTLAVNCWGGPLITKVTEQEYQQGRSPKSTNEGTDSSSSYAFDIDGSVYLRKWMKSPSWTSNASVAFWKNSLSKRGIVFSKNHVVADMNLMERAAMTCRDKYQVAEKTQATIDAAMIEGIPSNIDLFKELVFPLTVVVKNFEKLRRWEDPLLTASSLALTYTLIFRNMLSYVFPAVLMVLAVGMLLLKGLKEQGRLGRYFGKVTIRDQPPSNTLQKIIAVKEALREVERYMQSLNVSLLKIRAIILAGQPQITMEVSLAILFGATILLIVPFKYIAVFLISDAFTRELKFRRPMVLRFKKFLKERWDTVPATPVVVLPFEDGESDAPSQRKESSNDVVKPQKQLKQ